MGADGCGRSLLVNQSHYAYNPQDTPLNPRFSPTAFIRRHDALHVSHIRLAADERYSLGALQLAMSKLGDEYQALVGAVREALDPEASVRVGVWVVGPDGKRDLDVEVRGTFEGKNRFVLIECKDWASPVGIAVVDALDSKRRDLIADEAVIYSNSGFTEPALRKATRLEIGMASALKAGDSRVRIVIHKELVAKRLSVDMIRTTVYPQPSTDLRVPDAWQLSELTFDEIPVQNWLAPLINNLLRDHEPTGKWQYTCTFHQSTSWAYAGNRIAVAALRMDLDCTRSWVSQTVREDVTLGMYDHIRRRVSIPDKQGYFLGTIDQEAWKPYVGEPHEPALEPNSFALRLTLLNPLRPANESPAPRLDELVIEQEFKSQEAP